jgi:hypothetical protein
MLDHERVVNQPAVENGGDKGLEELCFFVVTEIDGSITAGAWGAHGSAICLFEKSVAKREDVVPHDDIEAFQDLDCREIRW